MSELNVLWNLPVAAYWLQVAWVLSAAGWALMVLLWSVQTYMAASRTRWPAMYIHGFKAFIAMLITLFFLLSLLWRDPTGTTPLGVYSRNVLGGLIVLALFIEACWRIKEVAKSDARARVVQDVPFLKETP